MPRWLWWAPLAFLVICLGLWGFRLGWIAATLTEMDVINKYALKYLADRSRDGIAEGAVLTDCLAYPGQDRGIWVVVSCGPDPFNAGQHYEYYVNRFGGLEYSAGPRSQGVRPGARNERPET